MTYRPRATCKRCGARRSAAVPISRRGNCPPCGVEALADNVRDLHGHAGVNYLHWLDSWARAADRLRGEAQIPIGPAQIPVQGILFEEDGWQAGAPR